MIKFGAAVIAACLGVIMVPVSSQGRSLGPVEGLPFFANPYPYGYVYHPPRLECYDIQKVNTPDGPRLQETWICGAPVKARY
jgi:hypothetical protein